MNREKSLVKNTIILSLGTYLPKLTLIITLPILTGYLTQAEFGTYDLIITLLSLLLPALTLQIQSAAFRFLIHCRDDKEQVSAIITNIFAFTVPVSVVGLCITYFCLGSLVVSSRLIVLLYFFSDIIYIGCGQVARGLGKNLIYATGAVMVSLANMTGIVISSLVFHAGLNGVLISMLVSNLLGNLLLIWRVGIQQKIDMSRLSVNKIKGLLAYSWPMVPNALSNWILSLSDRLVILNFLGVEMNAIYAVANKIPNMVKTFQGTFTSAWQENASITVSDSDSQSYYSHMLDSINNIVVGIVLLLLAFTPVLYKILIRGDYDAAYQQMSILYISMYFSCMSGFIGGIYIAHMKTKSVGLTTVCAAVINLAIDILTIKHIGLYAASLSTLIAYALLFIFRLINVQKFQPLKVKYGKMIFLIFIMSIMSIVIARRNTLLAVYNAILGLGLACFINGEIIKTILSALKKRLQKKL